MYRRDGFPGQRFAVLPRPVVDHALREPVTDRFLVTDAGYFPHATDHGRSRPGGCSEAVVILCVAGSGRCHVEGEQRAVRSGDALLIAPGVPHRYAADGTDPWSIWWIHAAGKDMPDLVREAQGLHGPVRPVGDLESATVLLRTACDELSTDESRRSLLAAAGAGWHLLALLASSAQRERVRDDEPIQRLLATIRTDLAARIDVAELARRCGYSRSHFAARFKAVTGSSVLAYVTMLRMARSRELLVTGSLSVAEIAHAVGFADAFYFSRQFHAAHGLGPRAFRDRARQEMVSDAGGS